MHNYCNCPKCFWHSYRDVSPPLLTSTSVSANPPMDEARKMSGPQTRAKTAAAQFDSKDTKMVAKSPRKVVSTTADKTDSGNDSGPKTITNYYSLRSGTKSAGVHVCFFVLCIEI